MFAQNLEELLPAVHNVLWMHRIVSLLLLYYISKKFQ
jgi:hypothetical protein